MLYCLVAIYFMGIGIAVSSHRLNNVFECIFFILLSPVSVPIWTGYVIGHNDKP